MNMFIKQKHIIKKLLGFSIPHFRQPEEIIMKEGDDADNFYIIASGECHVLINSIDCPERHCEKTHAIANMKKGSYFGEIALINCCQRTATVITTSYSTFAVIEKTKFF